MQRRWLGKIEKLVLATVFVLGGSCAEGTDLGPPATPATAAAKSNRPSQDAEPAAAPRRRPEPPRPAGHALVVPGREGLLHAWRIRRLGAEDVGVDTAPAPPTFCEERAEGCALPPEHVASPEILRFDPCGEGDCGEGDCGEGDGGIELEAHAFASTATTLHLFLGVEGTARVMQGERVVLELSSDRLQSDHGHAALALGEGRTALRIHLRGSERGRCNAQVRILNEDLQPGLGPVSLSLGKLDRERQQALAREALRVDEEYGVDATAATLHVQLSLPAGGPTTPLHTRLASADSAGDMKTIAPDHGVHGSGPSWDVQLPERGVLNEAIVVDGTRVVVGERSARVRPLLRDLRDLREALSQAGPSADAPIRWRIEQLEALVAGREQDGRWRAWMRSETRRIMRAVGRGQRPFERLRGYERMAFVSELDDGVMPYELFVPPAYRERGTQSWPLVVTLHGFEGNAGDYFRNTFGLFRDARGGESLLAHGRHGEAPTDGSMVVVAPSGRGQAMYRHAGEIDVFEAIADVQQRVRIDPRRIYITGGSMGGTGAAYLALRRPDFFAAAAPLAGYHDQRVREDTRHAGLSKVEQYMQAHRSDVDWAENALHVPMLLARGTKDPPLEWTRRLVGRMQELGYAHEHREPVWGHDVWKLVYADGAIFDWFRPYRAPLAPRHVRLRTARERTSRSHWIAIDQRESAMGFGSVDGAILEGKDAIRLSTTGVAQLTVFPAPPTLSGATPVEIEIDGQPLRASLPLFAEKVAGTWRPRAAEDATQPRRKTAGVSGPIRDVFHEPLTFVVGTDDPRHTLINRLVADYWAHPPGWWASYPIVNDRDVTAEMIAERTLVLIGPPTSNRLLRQYADRLPIRIAAEAVVVADRRYEGSEVGAVFVYPNPDHPERSLLVIAGTTPIGTWRSLSLPDLLPDYVVYDDGIAKARGQWSAGGSGARYREEGIFDLSWELPAR